MNFFYQMKESVIDFRFYKTIKDNRFAKSFLYLTLLFLIIYSFMTVQNYLIAQTIMERAAFNLSNTMPNFELRDGRFSFEGKMPYYISSSTNELVVIDTTGAVDVGVLDNALTGILVTQDQIYLKNNVQLQQFSFADFKELEFSKQDLIDFLPSVSWLVLIAMIAAFVFVLGWKLLNAVLLALVGIMINQVYKTDLKFRHLLNFSIYALTLPMLIQLAASLSGYMIPFFSVIYWGISILYIHKAIIAYKGSGSDTELT